FFLPELAYSEKVARLLRDLKFRWLILDEISFNGQLSQVNLNQKYILKNTDLGIIFRNRKISNIFFTGSLKSTSDFSQALKEDGRSNQYLITALDGENLGHHQKGMDKLWAEILDSPIETLTFSELLNKQTQVAEEIKPRPASWSSRPEELAQNIPYALWNNPVNEIHQLQWKLTNLVIKTVNQFSPDPNFLEARNCLDKALASDQYWWASAQPWWSQGMIEDGLQRSLKAINQLSTVPKKTKDTAENLAHQVRTKAQEWKQTNKLAKMRREYLKQEEPRFFGGQEIK
ncbi:MAG TPA: hypothetical protein ENI16_00105, partial [Candidatus Portnoybacteria bacterium]|nr:hypothetical protein [Candidatus Portnoybacteria bacterium]